MLIPSKKYIETKPEKVVNTPADIISLLMLLIVSGVFITPLVVNRELYYPNCIDKKFFFVRWMILRHSFAANRIKQAANIKSPLNRITEISNLKYNCIK